MSVLNRLAGALGRNDEEPNRALAFELAKTGNEVDVVVLADALSNASRPIQNDAIKVLYELGAVRPDMIRPHVDVFLSTMDSRNNRLAWGSLTALDALAQAYPDLIAEHLPNILDAADRSSVIAKDKAVSMLVTLASLPEPLPEAWERLLAMLQTAAVNQVPMYAEAALRAASRNDPSTLAEVVRKRLQDIHQPAKRARLEKVLRQLSRM